MDAQPAEAVVELRRTLRAAIADVWGAANVPEAEEPFLPHLSLAYINRDGPAAPLAQSIGEIKTQPTRTAIDSCQLIVINRDDLMYKWELHARVQLGGKAQPAEASSFVPSSESLATATEGESN